MSKPGTLPRWGLIQQATGPGSVRGKCPVSAVIALTGRCRYEEPVATHPRDWGWCSCRTREQNPWGWTTDFRVRENLIGMPASSRREALAAMEM